MRRRLDCSVAERPREVAAVARRVRSLRLRRCNHTSRGLVCMVDAPVAEPELEQEDALDVPWNVVVHNDPVNLMSYVVKVFMKVLGFSSDRARKHMLEVHHKGRSIVWTGQRERCEFYVQQLHAYLLLATMEKSV